MPYALRRLLNVVPLPSGMWIGRRWRAMRMKTAPVAVSAGNRGFQMHRFDRYEQSARRWRVAKWVFIWVTAFLAAWIALESMRALTLA